MATKSFKTIDAVKAGMEVIKAKNAGVTLDTLKNVTATDFTQIMVPKGTKVAIPEVEEIDSFLYNDKSTLNGVEYDNYGILCPVVDASMNVVGTKRVPLRSFERQMPEYAMVDGVPTATGKTKGGDTNLAVTLRSKEIMSDKVKYLCGKVLEVTDEVKVDSPRYTNGIMSGIRPRTIPVWDIAK